MYIYIFIYIPERTAGTSSGNIFVPHGKRGDLISLLGSQGPRIEEKNYVCHLGPEDAAKVLSMVSLQDVLTLSGCNWQLRCWCLFL